MCLVSRIDLAFPPACGYVTPSAKFRIPWLSFCHISKRPPYASAPLQIILIEPTSQDCKALSAQLRECSYEGTKPHLAGLDAASCCPSATRLCCAVCECADETEASQNISKAEQEFDLLICEVCTTDAAPVRARQQRPGGTLSLRMHLA